MAVRAGSVSVGLGFELDDRQLKAYQRELDQVQARTQRRDAFKAHLGGDFDARAFNAYERAIAKAKVETTSLSSSTSQLKQAMRDFNQQAAFARNVMGQIKWPALITGAGLAAQAFSALAAGATALGSALAPAAGALVAYPALGSAAAQGLGVFKLATDGVFKAVGGLNQNLDQNSTAFKKLDPEARRFAVTLDGLKKPLRDLPAMAQKGLLPGLREGIEDASKNLPVVRDIVSETADAMGDLATQAGELVGSRGFGRDLATQGERNTRWIRLGGDSALHLGNALRNVTLAGGPLVDWLVRAGNGFAKVVDQQAASARESGKLAHFFDESRVAISRLARIGGDLAVAFFNIARAGKPLGDSILVSLVRSAETFKDWTASASGRNSISQYFKDAQPAVFELGGLIRDAGALFFRLGRGDQVAPLLRTIRVDILPSIGDLIDSTTQAFGPPLLEAIDQVVQLLARMAGSSGPLVMLVRMIGKAAGAMNTLLDKFPQLQSAMTTIIGIGGLYSALKIAGAITGVSRLIRLFGTLRGAAVAAGTAEAGASAAAGGAGAAAGVAGGAAGGARRLLSRIPVAGQVAIGVGVAAAAASRINWDDRLPPSDKITSSAAALDRLNRNLNKLDQIGDNRGASRIAAQFDKLVDSSGKFRGSARDVDRLTRAAGDLIRQGGTVNRDLGRALDQAARHFADFRKTGSNNLHGLHTATADNMNFIKRTLGEDSRAGKEALARNFRLARTAVRDAMNDGKVSVGDGLREIRRLMSAELKVYGLSNDQIRNYSRSSGHGSGNEAAGGGHATGGWIGPPGAVGTDTVPAMLGVGEAVLNRHQQAVIEGLLGDGFLDRLFATVNKPHYLASGGIVSVPGFPGERAAASVIPMIESIARQFALTLTDAFGAGHKSPGHTRFGTAADFAGPDRNMDRAVRYLVGQGYLVGYDGRYGSADWPGHGPAAGQGGSNAHLHVELGGKGGGGGAAGAIPALGAVWEAIRAPRTGLPGLLGGVAQGAMDRTASAANSRGRALVASALSTPVPGGGGGAGGLTSAGGGFDKAALAALWRQAGGPANVANLMAAIALAESGGNPNAHNPSGATGLWQILGNPFPGNARDPLTNARMAVSKYQSQGLGAWEAYTRGMHKRFLSGGGFARFARGGFARSKLNRTVGGATAGLIRKIRPTQTDRSARFDRLLGHVEAWDQDYGRWERRFNVTDEELVDADTGQVNVAAVQTKAKELGRLIEIRARIEHELEKAQVVVRNIISSYQRVIRALRNSLRHAKRKNRKGIQSYITQYEGRVDEWRGKLDEVGGTLFDTRTDLQELRLERRSVLGTTATPQTPDTPDAPDTADTGAADTGADATTAPPTPLQIAEAAAAEMRTFISGRQDLLSSFGRNFAPGTGAGVLGSSDPLTLAAGARAFGASMTGGLGAGGGGGMVIANFASAPDNAPTFVQQVRFLVEGGGG